LLDDGSWPQMIKALLGSWTAGLFMIPD